MKQFERIGRYDVRMQIGRGAMGTVFEGFDPQIGRRVAIKTLRTELFDAGQLAGVLARFKREAQSAGRLSHPNIVTIYEYGEEQGTPYIAMEYLQGNELGTALSRGTRFNMDEIATLMSQLLGALAHAHDNGVVHRDLKPANMFVVDRSLKVVDFGIARVEASDLTDTGAMLGTPAYMSPEQCLGLQVDKRSDIFSAGIILYQLLTGDRPFTGSTTTIIQKVLRQEPLPPSDLNPTISTSWDRIVAKAMAKKPDSRFESARHFLEAMKLAHKAEQDISVSVEVKKGRPAPRAQPDDSAGGTTTFSAPTALAPGPHEPATASVKASQKSRLPLFAAMALVLVGGAGFTIYQVRESALESARAERAEAEKRLKTETEARAAAEAKARAESEARAKAESTAAQALAAQKEAAIREAKAEAERRKQAEANEIKAKAEARSKIEAELRASAIAKQQAERLAAERDAAARAAADRAAAERLAAERVAAEKAATRAAAQRAAEQRKLQGGDPKRSWYQ